MKIGPSNIGFIQESVLFPFINNCPYPISSLRHYYIHANMEACLKLLPHKSYNKFGLLYLTLFVSIGVVLIGIASDFDSKSTIQCNPDKTLASDLSTRKYIDTQCLLKYAQEFIPLLPLHNLLTINFGLVLLLSIIYAYSVKDRVEIFADPPSATTNIGEEENQPLSGISQAASDPVAHQNSAGGYFVLKRYIMHLILCRIIPLVAFAVFLLRSSNFPVQYHCPWPTKTTSSPHANFTQTQTTNYSIVDCTYPMGNKIEQVGTAVVTINFLFSTVAFVELAYLVWSSWKDDNLLTDLEFCCVYLLRKRKRIRKLFNKIREKIPPHDIFYLHDDFGEKHLSRRKLEEMYVNVIIQQGRESAWPSNRKFKGRHEIYDAHFKVPVDATTLTKTSDLFKLIPKDHPKTILVVGRPGIGKTLLTKKIFHQWKQQAIKFWHDKMVILIRFRNFNDAMNKTSLREMLRHSDGLNMSTAEFNYIYEYICLFPNNLILIFDGLDELKINEESLTESKPVNSHNEVTHILQIFKQLVKNELLPGATVLTTSRPTAEQVYKHYKFYRNIEILGFHEKQIKEYVGKFCRNDIQKSLKIWQLIKASRELLTLCYIPVNSYIVCLTLKESIEAEGQSNIPTTITELYERAVKILLYRHHSKYKGKDPPKDYIIAKLPDELQKDLEKLKKIARNGIREQQLVFEFRSDDEFFNGLDDCGLFNKLDDKRQNIFCFLHLTIQEFLAALHVVNDMNDVESFLSEHIDKPKWHLVIQFVAGLIGDKMRELEKERNLLERYFKLQHTCIKRKERTLSIACMH